MTVTGELAVSVWEEKFTVMPAGAPLTDSVIGELNPPSAFSLKVTFALLPCPTDTVKALGVSKKLEALRPLQWLTSRKASTEPSPVTKS